MFRCEGACKKVIGPGVSPIKTVVETRKVQYRQKDSFTGDVQVFYGSEIVREINLCRDCAPQKEVPCLKLS